MPINNSRRLNQLDSTVEKILKQRQDKEQDELINQEELNKWKIALNSIIETPEGKLFFDKYIKFMGLFCDMRGINAQSMAEINGSRTFYLKHVRPYLDKLNINKVE